MSAALENSLSSAEVSKITAFGHTFCSEGLVFWTVGSTYCSIRKHIRAMMPTRVISFLHAPSNKPVDIGINTRASMAWRSIAQHTRAIICSSTWAQIIRSRYI